MKPEEKGAAPVGPGTNANPNTDHSNDRLTILPDNAPATLAAHFLKVHYTDTDGHLLLRRWRGCYYGFRGSAYRAIPNDELKARLWRALEKLPYRTSKGEERVRATKDRVGEIQAALLSSDILVDESCDAPSWLGVGTGPDPRELVVCRNGILHVPTRRLLEPTPELFALNALPFDYDPDAPAPTRWIAFLNDLFADDEESKNLVQEWCGYCLTPDTRQQKILLITGPRRSGKGTIGRVLAGLLGSENVCAPTFADLSRSFGLQGLLGKSAAIVSDARLSKRTDGTLVGENLLRISGEDPVSVQRKYLSPWEGRLPTRFTILTNEPPRLEDRSGALEGRLLVVKLTTSFYGREDTGLSETLLKELPGILNWALDGYSRLRVRGHFIQPASAQATVQDLEIASRPVAAFMKQRCVVSPHATVGKAALYSKWMRWCNEQSVSPRSPEDFAKELRALLPTIDDARLRHNGSRVMTWRGLGLKGGQGGQCPRHPSGEVEAG